MPSRLSRSSLKALSAAILLFLMLPILIIVPLSFSAQQYLSFPPTGFSLRWYQTMAANPAWIDATLNSLVIGIPTAVLSMILGTLAALAVVRGEIPFASFIAAAVVAPVMLPHIILAIGLYPVMLEFGMLRSYLAAIVGHTVIGVPLAFITVSASLRGYDGALEQAAMTLGATLWQTFWRVTFPMIRPGIIVGGILAFASSFDELMLSLFLTGATTRTLPRLIWEQLTDFLTPTIAAVATLVFVFSLVLLTFVALFQRRSSSTVGGRHA